MPETPDFPRLAHRLLERVFASEAGIENVGPSNADRARRRTLYRESRSGVAKIGSLNGASFGAGLKTMAMKEGTLMTRILAPISSYPCW